MADSGRRFTMQPPNPDILGASRTGIPMSTAKKPASGMRMSMAGPALRGPYPPPAMAPPSTNPRQSLYRSQNVNPLLASASKSNYGRTPLTSSARRGSVWGGGMPPPTTTQVGKDTRPLRERQYQSKMRQDIFALLQSTSYDISMQTLISINGRDYRGIFNHLVLLLDGNYPFDPKLRFEDEFLPALKALQYPFVNQLDTKWLAAPASMHSWPALLGVLHWLAMMCKGRLHYLESMHWTLLDSVDVPDIFDDQHHHNTLAFEHYSEAYEVFLSGVDDYSAQERALEARYDKKNESVLMELEEQKKLLNDAQIEYARLMSEAPPIEKLQDTNKSLKRDREKFQQVITRWEGRKKKLIDSIAKEKAELAMRANYLEEVKAEQGKLSDIVREQNLSPEEVIRMNTEHEQLSRNLEDLRHKIAESSKLILSLEVTVTNRASAAEEALDAYTNLLSTLGLFPPLPRPYEDIDLTLELNTAASNPQQLLLGADIRRVIKPTLSGIAESKRNERANIESERIKVDNDLDQLVLECENMEEEIHEIEKKVGALNEQAEELREAAQQEAHVNNAEAARLERELAQARTAALAHGVGVKSRLQGLQIAYREQIEKVARLKDETVRAIVKNSSDIAMFKESISQQLKDLRDFAEAN
ncbi:hypothetical protein EW146_g5652 [Bondarzewia mesenterica]|uniref:Kinetochore protein NDC80 n=1 Tax=Bondarzewia mesenterica TaxID=1095465 RepID=A0A4S4LQS9_9AGAM|nr:hypothetical protein EW146_g5652 [Bondarzewia mesenterica]